MWKLKRKDNRTDQNTLQCYYGYSIDKGKKVGTIFMDLSEAFDTLNHDLLLAKLSAYGFCFSVIKLIQIYLLERFQRVNINNNFSEWCKILLGVPQESIPGPLLLNAIFSLMAFSFSYKKLIFATLLMIIHYIQLRIISKKLKLF